MAIADNDILQITFVQSVTGQVVNNVFFYRADDPVGTPDYGDVADGFISQVVVPLVATQSVDVGSTRIVIKNITNNLDIYEEANSNAGSRSGPVMPSFVAWAFRLVRSSALTRHGAKRIAGPSESDVADNGPVSGVLTVLTALATAMGEDFVVNDGGGNTVTLVPVIVGRTENVDGDYELDLTKINPVASANFIRVTSQTTRRAGRGI